MVSWFNGRLLEVVFLVLLLVGSSVHGWTNEEYEMFDLVEELAPVTLYEFLGLSNVATLKEIKSAYRQLSVKLHPDKNPDDENAAVKFRQLVGAYEALKDDELRKSYHNVLEFGLPNWRQPVFYFRRARKLAIWQVGVLLLIIVTTGQYLAAWGSYFEKKLSLNEMVESRFKKQRSKRAQKDGPKVEEVQAELEEQFLQRPSVYNTAPFQLVRFGKYLVCQFPFDFVHWYQQIQDQREKEQQRLLQKKLEEEARNIPPEPKKPRKRKTFQAPERAVVGEDNGVETGSNKSGSNSNDAQVEETFVSGGNIWTDDDIAQLIKLCTKFPGGYPDRWNQISLIMRRPVGEITHMSKTVLDDLNKKTTDEEEELVVPVKVKVKTKGSKIEDSEVLQKVLSWSKEEQKRLEAALSMYPKSTVGDRWAKIASHVGKSKEECMQRFKHVADLVRKKKEQEQAELEEKVDVPTAHTEHSSDVIISREQAEDVVKQNAISRQSSSSSNCSDNDWCIVDDNR